MIDGSFYNLSHAHKFLTLKIYHRAFALFLKILEFLVLSTGFLVFYRNHKFINFLSKILS